MSTWLTEREYLPSEAIASGITINVAFLQEIKQETIELRELIESVATTLSRAPFPSPRCIMELMYRVREELETYFALEECYGYFDQAAVLNPSVSACAEQLKSEHEQLFLNFNDVVELIEQIVYRETHATLADVSAAFDEFRAQFDLHEQCEMELMLRLCNEDLGVGD